MGFYTGPYAKGELTKDHDEMHKQNTKMRHKPNIIHRLFHGIFKKKSKLFIKEWKPNARPGSTIPPPPIPTVRKS
jgi:hypothetical protein